MLISWDDHYNLLEKENIDNIKNCKESKDF